MRQVLDAIPPASGAIVMASGVVSIDLYSDHQPVLSAILLWFAAGVWLLLAVLLGMRLAYQRDRFAREAISPAAFTGAAGTAVLGTRLAIHDHAAAAALLAVSGLCWAVLWCRSCGTGRPRRPGLPSSSASLPKASPC